MGKFIPCQGNNACRDNELRCLTCGRGVHEIEQLRQLMDQLASLAIDYDYENIDEYSSYVTRKLEKMITYRQENLQKGCHPLIAGIIT
ncbi:MAG: hypothetical protein DBP02_06185 [gamma proteobacterium symbiont of Ctena orbiculata]|nr:MAG: hypothetical protein DBP02_06185 [gamma proteobacterium symbiont of Ctena orbiculata]